MKQQEIAYELTKEVWNLVGKAIANDAFSAHPDKHSDAAKAVAEILSELYKTIYHGISLQ